MDHQWPSAATPRVLSSICVIPRPTVGEEQSSDHLVGYAKVAFHVGQPGPTVNARTDTGSVEAATERPRWASGGISHIMSATAPGWECGLFGVSNSQALTL